VRLCGGGFGIFGHGNVTCLGEALYDRAGYLAALSRPERASMGFAAAAYAKHGCASASCSAPPRRSRHRQSLDRGRLAHANRLPMLMLCGDTF
jgi:3D-(3,5/4)-trihydroxycyclohexane-1,2-dione acylhydrolase (decyclizing)